MRIDGQDSSLNVGPISKAGIWIFEVDQKILRVILNIHQF
jgi:hypothetical protein